MDGKIRRDGRFGVGIMDIVEVIPSGDAYRMVPKELKIIGSCSKLKKKQ